MGRTDCSEQWIRPMASPMGEFIGILQGCQWWIHGIMNDGDWQDVGHVSKSREIKMVCVELMATKTNMGIYWVLFNCIYLPVRIRIVWDFFALTNGITWIMVFLRESNVWRATWNSTRHCSVSIAGFCHHWTKWWMLSDATFEHPEGIYDY